MPTGNDSTQIKKDISAQSGNVVITQQDSGQMMQEQDSFTQLLNEQKTGILHEYFGSKPLEREERREEIEGYKKYTEDAKFRRTHLIKTAKMKKAIASAEKEIDDLNKNRETFFAPCKLWSNDMAEQLNSLKDAGVEDITKAFVKCINSEKTVNDDKINIKSVNTEKLVKNGDFPKVAEPFREMFNELSQKDIDKVTLEETKVYIEKYKELESKLTVKIPAARHLDTAKLIDAKASYVMLYHCVANMLQYQLNNVDSQNVDATEFSKLYAISQTSAIAANKLVISDDYQGKIKDYGIQLLVKARKEYLREKDSKGNARTITPYAEIAEKLIGDKISTLSDKEFEAEVAGMEKNIEDNAKAIEEYYGEQVKEMPMLEKIKAEVVGGLLGKMDEAALKEVVKQDEMSKLFDEYVNEKEQNIALCMKEIRNITNVLASLPDDAESTAITKAFTKHAGEIDTIPEKELFEGGTPAEFEELEKIYSELSGMTAEKFTEEEAKKFSERYRKFSGMPNAERVDEAGTMDPDSCYLIIYNGVLNMLYNKVKDNGTSKANEDALLKLYTKLKLSETAVNALIANNDYKNTRENNRIKLLVKARKEHLQEWAKGKVKENDKLTASYAEAAEKILGDEISTLSDAEFKERIARMGENIESNAKSIKAHYDGQVNAMPMLAKLEKSVVGDILLKLEREALDGAIESASDKMRDVFKGYVSEKEPVIALCMEEIETITKDLTSLAKDTKSADITKAYTKCADKINKIPEKALFEGGVGEDKELEDMYNELSGMTAEKFTEEDAKKFSERYRKFSGMPNAERVDEAGTMDPDSCYLIIYNGVLNMLYDKITKNGTSKANEDALLKLYTKLKLSETTVNALIANNDYKEKRKENLQKITDAIMQEKKMRQQEAITEARKKYLREGISGSEKAEEWPIGPYAEIAEKILGDEIFSLSNGDFARRVARMEECLERNTVEVKRYCSKQIEDDKSLFGLRETIVEKMLPKLGENLLNSTGISDDILNTALTELKKDENVTIEKYEARMKTLKEKKSLESLSDALNSAEIANMIYKLNDGAFTSAVDVLSKQAEKNIDIAKKLIAEKTTGKNKDDAMDAFIARRGQTLLFGAPSVVYMETEYFLDYLRQFAPEVARYEDSLRLQIKKSGIDDRFSNTILRSLSEQAKAAKANDEEQFIKENLVKNKTLIVENTKHFDEKVSGLKLDDKDWEAVFTWQEENIMLSEDKTDPNGFAKELEKKLSGLKGNLSRKEYERKKSSDTPDAIGNANTTNIDFIRGEGLCGWSGFNGVLAGKENVVMDALDKALKNGVFKEFKDVKQLGDIESLPYTELNSMILTLRSNMVGATKAWSEIKDGNHSEEVKNVLLYELLCGKLSEDDVKKRAEAVEKDIESKIDVGKIRLKTILAGDAPAETSQVRYLHLSETAFTGIRGEVSRPVRRNLRFATANDIWKKIEDANLTDLMQEYWSERVSDYNYPVHKIIEKIGDKISDLGKAITKAEKAGDDNTVKAKTAESKNLQELQNILKELPENCENEFMLRGMQDEFLSYTDIGKVFTSGDNNVYNGTLGRHTGILIERYMEVEAALGNMGKEKKAKYHAKIKKLIAGIEPVGAANPTEEQQRLNREKFGVPDWGKALEAIKEFVSKQDNGAAGYVKKLKETTQKLAGNDNLKPFADIILQNKESYGVLMTANEKDVELHLGKLEAILKEPYEALKTYNINGQFAKEFIIEHAKELLVEVNDPKKHWTGKVEGYFNTFCEYKVGKVSFRTRYEKLSKNEILKPYLAQIVLYDDEGISILLNMDRKKLKIFEDRIIANEKELETFLQDQKQKYPDPKDDPNSPIKAENMEHPFIKGFRMYVRDMITRVGEVDFKNNLGKYLNEFQAKDTEAKAKTKSEKDERAKYESVRVEIEEKKKVGFEADSENRKILEKMRDNQEKYISPIMFARKCEKKPSKSDVSKKRKEINEKYKKTPNIVKEILVESSFAGAKDEQLEVEKEKLMKAYDVINNTEFKISDDVKLRLNEAEAGELLTVLFMNGKLDINADDMTEALNGILECHDKIRALAAIKIDDAGLLAERDSLIDTLSVGMYTTEKDTFNKIADGKIKYIKASAEALKIFHKCAEDYKEKEEAALCAGLREYFHKELLQGNLSDVSWQKFKEELLEKNDDYRYVTCRFLKNSKQIEDQRVGSKDEIKTTSSIHTVVQKSDFELYLYSLKDQGAIKSYMAMDLARQQIFAMALGAPGQDEVVLGSGKLQMSEKRDAALKIEMREYIQKYISHEAFTPIVDYTRALDRLKKADGTFDKEAFKRAEKFTEAVYKEYQKNIPVDFDRLGDGMSSYIAAKRLLQKNVDDEKFNVTNYQDFLGKLKNEDKDEAKDVKKKLESLSKHQLSLLVNVLQDRSVLDRSTKITAFKRAQGTEHEYANSEKREELKGALVKEGTRTWNDMLSSAALSNAMTSLLSYQLRDDVELSKGALQKSDFAKKALERKTVIDWYLLSEALLFVHEIEKETHRLNAVKQADSVILVSGNEAAIAKYKECQKKPVTKRKGFEAYLLEQAKKDNMPALYAGYSQLDDAEKALFIKVLGQRHLLDISKENIGLNRLGMAERDYVDSNGRNELIDEFIENTLIKGMSVELDDKSYRRAVDMTLSTQINDDIDFTLKKDKSLEEFLTSQSNPFKNVRKTAVDWKLVGRALQFVHRAVNEKDIFREDRELYVSQGNLLQNGRFSFDNEHLRKNIHNAGSRFGRYFFSRVKENLSDQIPSYLQPVLSGAMFAARMTLSAKNADKITKLGIIDDVNFDIRENFSDFFSGGEFINETSSGLFEKGNDFYGDYLAETVKRKAGEEKYKIAEGKLETAGEHIGYTNTAIEALMAGGKLGYLAHAKGKSNKAKAGDEKKTEEAKAHQTTEQQELSKKAIDRNFDLQYQGRSYAVNRQVDTIINGVASVIGSAAVENEYLAMAVAEAGEFINFVRSYIQDRKSIVKFFKKNGELEKMRGTYDSLKWDKKEELDDSELILKMKGYENYTELSSFVGIDITRSLLFSASKYNPQDHLSILAIATLVAVGQKDAIGKQDAETAQAVFDAIMGSDYR